MAQIPAPEGYQSYYAAMQDLWRFGYGVWTVSQVTALLFHADRSIGKESDRHSRHQAIRGIYSSNQGRWIRGPSGLGKGTWERANAALVKSGVLVRERRWTKNGKNDWSEYTVVWPAVAKAIEEWKRVAIVEEGASRKGVAPKWGDPSPQNTPIIAPKRGDPSPQNGEIKTTRIPSPQIGPTQSSQSQSLDFRGPSQSARARDAVEMAIELACGERVRSPRLTDSILETGLQLNLPLVVLERFIHDFCNKLQAKGTRVNPGLVGRGVREDLISWLRAPDNKFFIEGAQRKAELEAQRQFEVEAMRDPAEVAAQRRLMEAAVDDPENAEKFMEELGRRLHGKGQSG